jgi:hypothetical protein
VFERRHDELDARSRAWAPHSNDNNLFRQRCAHGGKQPPTSPRYSCRTSQPRSSRWPRPATQPTGTTSPPPFGRDSCTGPDELSLDSPTGWKEDCYLSARQVAWGKRQTVPLACEQESLFVTALPDRTSMALAN